MRKGEKIWNWETERKGGRGEEDRKRDWKEGKKGKIQEREEGGNIRKEYTCEERRENREMRERERGYKERMKGTSKRKRED